MFAFSSSTANTIHHDIAEALRPTAALYGKRVVPVSWEDVSRWTDGEGNVSCWGNNIADVTLVDRKHRLFVMREQNLNERVVVVKASELAVIVGNEEPTASKKTRSVTLAEYLTKAGTFASIYAKTPADLNLYQPDTDERVHVRIQCVFLPPKSEVATQVYSYGTRSKSNPQNLFLYVNGSGTSLSQAQSGTAKLYATEVHADGNAHDYMLKTDVSTFAVGGAQQETADTIQAATAKHQFLAQHIGLPTMGKRCNVVMLVQVPLEKKPERTSRGGGYEMCAASAFAFGAPSVSAVACAFPAGPSRGRPKGVSSAARMSLGECVGSTSPLETDNFKRHPKEHITATITLYYVVDGGVPSEADVHAACKDVGELYASMGIETKLSDTAAASLGVVQKQQPLTFTCLEQQGFPTFNATNATAAMSD